MSPALIAFSTAKGFVQSAFLIASNPLRLQLPNDSNFVLGFHHLIGFAVELYLKAFLLEKGIDQKTLRNKPYSHDLSKLLELANTYGLNSFAAGSLCLCLNKHGTFEYRYMKENASYDLLPPHLIFDQLDQLNGLIDTTLSASTQNGVQPSSGGWNLQDELKEWRTNPNP